MADAGKGLGHQQLRRQRLVVWCVRCWANWAAAAGAGGLTGTSTASVLLDAAHSPHFGVEAATGPVHVQRSVDDVAVLNGTLSRPLASTSMVVTDMQDHERSAQ